MIKQLLSICTMAILVGISSLSYGQCTPDAQYTQAGVYPDSATNFADACATLPYQQVVTVIVPADTLIELIPGFPQTVSMDSIVVTNISGYPSGFSYDCLTANCAFVGNSTSCLVINGTPTAGDVGNYPLNIDLDVYIGGIVTPFQQTVGYYEIEVLAITDPSCVLSIDNLSTDAFTVGQNVPNPFSGNSIISFSSGSTQNMSFSVVDMLGKVVLEKNISATLGENNIRLSSDDLEGGVYLYSLTNGSSTVTRRMVVSK